MSAVAFHSSHHPQEIVMALCRLYVHKDCLNPIFELCHSYGALSVLTGLLYHKTCKWVIAAYFREVPAKILAKGILLKDQHLRRVSFYLIINKFTGLGLQSRFCRFIAIIIDIIKFSGKKPLWYPTNNTVSIQSGLQENGNGLFYRKNFISLWLMMVYSC